MSKHITFSQKKLAWKAKKIVNAAKENETDFG
jgi:hypothetical protein